MSCDRAQSEGLGWGAPPAPPPPRPVVGALQSEREVRPSPDPRTALSQDMTSCGRWRPSQRAGELCVRESCVVQETCVGESCVLQETCVWGSCVRELCVRESCVLQEACVPPRPPPLLPFQCLRLAAKFLLRHQEDLSFDPRGTLGGSQTPPLPLQTAPPPPPPRPLLIHPRLRPCECGAIHLPGLVGHGRAYSAAVLDRLRGWGCWGGGGVTGNSVAGPGDRKVHGTRSCGWSAAALFLSVGRGWGRGARAGGLRTSRGVRTPAASRAVPSPTPAPRLPGGPVADAQSPLDARSGTPSDNTTADAPERPVNSMSAVNVTSNRTGPRKGRSGTRYFYFCEIVLNSFFFFLQNFDVLSFLVVDTSGSFHLHFSASMAVHRHPLSSTAVNRLSPANYHSIPCGLIALALEVRDDKAFGWRPVCHSRQRPP